MQELQTRPLVMPPSKSTHLPTLYLYCQFRPSKCPKFYTPKISGEKELTPKRA